MRISMQWWIYFSGHLNGCQWDLFVSLSVAFFWIFTWSLSPLNSTLPYQILWAWPNFKAAGTLKILNCCLVVVFFINSYLVKCKLGIFANYIDMIKLKNVCVCVCVCMCMCVCICVCVCVWFRHLFKESNICVFCVQSCMTKNFNFGIFSKTVQAKLSNFCVTIICVSFTQLTFHFQWH